MQFINKNIFLIDHWLFITILMKLFWSSIYKYLMRKNNIFSMSYKRSIISKIKYIDVSYFVMFWGFSCKCTIVTPFYLLPIDINIDNYCLVLLNLPNLFFTHDLCSFFRDFCYFGMIYNQTFTHSHIKY